ncbi:MAG: SEL1-like repeat protein [Alphaproteobacteria bacterium]|nr:SEL1-like repeat protein [Alphaproteobacteria bacterium]MCB9974402.1 SEL1-like repeat protein [Rhodospirillales bacterium]
MPKRNKALHVIVFICFLSLVIGARAAKSPAVETPKNKMLKAWPISAFPEIKQGETQESFMRKVSDMLQGRLINVPLLIRYIDQDGFVTKEMQKAFETEVGLALALEQKHLFSPFDANADGAVSLKEIAEHEHVQIAHLEAFYKVLKEHGTQARDEIHRVYDAMMDSKAPVHVNSLFNRLILPFTYIDTNNDMSLSAQELDTPVQDNLISLTKDVVDEFEALRFLPHDNKPVSVQTISDYAIKTFQYFDRDKSGFISYDEYLNSFYTRMAEEFQGSRKACHLPDLSDSPGPTYAVYLRNTEATASYNFSQMANSTDYAELYIEKQNVPINLVLISSGIVWDIKGDTKSLNKVIVFSSGLQTQGYPVSLQLEDRYLQKTAWPRPVSPDEYVSAALIGVPKDKIQFVDNSFCLNLDPLKEQYTPVERHQVQDLNEQILGLAFDLKKPHLLAMQTVATHVLIKSSPEIVFDTKQPDISTALPKGFNSTYWERYLRDVPKGHKRVDPKTLVSGSKYFLEKPYYSGWGALAQFVHDEFLQELRYDPEKRKAIFLQKKELPFYPLIKNSWNITLILDRQDLHAPQPYNDSGRPSFADYCVFNKAGDYLYGHAQRCSKSDLAALQKKSETLGSKTVFLEMDKYLPVLSAGRESIEIKLTADEKRCAKAYGSNYKAGCAIPKRLKAKGALDFALTPKPGMDGSLSWKDDETLIFTPDSTWDYANTYLLSLSLGPDILINGEKSATTTFVSAPPLIELTNAQLTPDELEPEKILVSADIISNYNIQRLDDIQICHQPPGSLTPDTFFQANSECQTLMSEPPHNDLPFFMKDGKGRINLTLYTQPGSPSPTYIQVTNPWLEGTTGGGGIHQAIVFFKDPEDTKPYNKEVNTLISEAQKGNAQDQYALGMMYLQGYKIEKSLYRAEQWLTRAAEQDVKEAWLELGKFHLIRSPDRTPNSDASALYWLTKAAGDGNAQAQYYLGVLHKESSMGFLDGPLSLSWTQKAAEQSYLPALLSLGKVYEEGLSTYNGPVTKPDYKKAMQYYSAASEKGSLEGLAHVAQLYYLGLGVAEDHDKAYELAQEAIIKSSRDQLAVRDVAAKIIAEILLERHTYPIDGADPSVAQSITERVFKDFPQGFMRMWIGGALPVALDTIKQRDLTFDLPILEALVKRQEKETPNLPELKLNKAIIALNKGFAGKADIYNAYYESALQSAIKLLEPLLDDPVLDNDALYLLTDCYASMDEKLKMWKLFDLALYQKYFTLPELAQAFAWSVERIGNYGSAAAYYEIIGDKEGMARIRFRMFGRPDTYLDQLRKNVKNNPGKIGPLNDYAEFVYYAMGDYGKALFAATKALKIDPDDERARWMAGIAYAAKASQIYKKEGLSENVKKHMNAVKLMGLDKWDIVGNCGALYCKDICALIQDYYKKYGVSMGIDKEEIRKIEPSKKKSTPL